MKNKWISVGALGAVLLVVFVYLKLSVPPKDVLNSDGVRSDVAAAITSNFPNSEKTRAAATQMAKVIQMAIDEPENAVAIELLGQAADACYYAIRGEVLEDENTSVALKVEAMVVNSYQRSRAYIRYNGKLSGRIFEGVHPDFSKCDFDVDAMRN